MLQESRNRTSVRRLAVTNAVGVGIEILSIKEPLECNAYPCIAFKLEGATHLYELLPSHNKLLTTNGK